MWDFKTPNKNTNNTVDSHDNDTVGIREKYQYIQTIRNIQYTLESIWYWLEYRNRIVISSVLLYKSS